MTSSKRTTVRALAFVGAIFGSVFAVGCGSDMASSETTDSVASGSHFNTGFQDPGKAQGNTPPQGYPQGHPQGQPQGHPQGQPQGQPQGYPQGNPDFQGDPTPPQDEPVSAECPPFPPNQWDRCTPRGTVCHYGPACGGLKAECGRSRWHVRRERCRD